jgi:transposase
LFGLLFNGLRAIERSPIMNKKFIVRLTDGEREQLAVLVGRGKGDARKMTRARILLKADAGDLGPGWTDEQIATAFDVSPLTIHRVRQRFVERGLDATLTRRTQARRRPRKFDGDLEAKLIALACSQPPAGRRRWTLRMLADQLVELGCFGGVSHETIRQTLKKTS